MASADRPTCAGDVRATSRRAHQRRILRDAEPRAGGDLRAPQHHQLHARRAIHAGRVLRLVLTERIGARLLAGVDPGADHRRRPRDRDRAPAAAPYLWPRPPLRPIVDLWSGADHRRGVPPAIRFLWTTLRDPIRAAERP